VPRCASDKEFHDLDDVRFLLRHLDVSTVDEALAIATHYFDADQLPAKARLALEELLARCETPLQTSSTLGEKCTTAAERLFRHKTLRLLKHKVFRATSASSC
jgi:hypothetical protein